DGIRSDLVTGVQTCALPILAPRVPMLELMPRLDAVICQAGQSTVNEALVHGVPLVVAPIRLAEPLTAEHVTRAGAGIAVSFPEEIGRASCRERVEIAAGGV